MDSTNRERKPLRYRVIQSAPVAVIVMEKTDLTDLEGNPRWLIKQKLPDGTEKILGIQ